MDTIAFVASLEKVALIFFLAFAVYAFVFAVIETLAVLRQR